MNKRDFNAPFEMLLQHLDSGLSTAQMDLWFKEFRDVEQNVWADACYAARRFLAPGARFPSMDKMHKEVDRAGDRLKQRKKSIRQGQPLLHDAGDGSPATVRYIANIRRVVAKEITAEEGMAEYWRIRKECGDGQASPDATMPIPAPSGPVASQTGGEWGHGDTSGPEIGPQEPNLDEVDDFLPF